VVRCSCLYHEYISSILIPNSMLVLPPPICKWQHPVLRVDRDPVSNQGEVSEILMLGRKVGLRAAILRCVSVADK
jgi:hypothetical protein